MSDEPAPTHPPPWKFAVTCIPFGVSAGFQAIVMPAMLREAGISVEEIGWFGLAGYLPPILQPLWAPLVDVGLRRRTWLVLMASTGALCLAGALFIPLPAGKMHFLLLSMAGFLLSGLVGSCNGGLLATSMPDRMRGAAGGWLNVGNLASAALGAEITIKLMQSYGPRGASLSLLLLMSLPSLMALTIDEPRRPTRTQFGVLRPMLAELWRTARSRPGWTGILFCLSPVGTVALMSYFSALGKDYGVTAETVARVNGSLGAICTGLGSLAGGYICDRINRRVGYLAAAGLTAVCALVFAAAPLVPFAYVGGVLVYSVVAGLSYAAFSAVVLEIIGDAGASASTQYTLFTAAGNLAIAYTGFIDTRFHEAHGPRGLYVADAALNLLGIAVLSLMLRYVLQRKPAAPQAAAHPSAS